MISDVFLWLRNTSFVELFIFSNKVGTYRIHLFALFLGIGAHLFINCYFNKILESQFSSFSFDIHKKNL